MPDDETVWAVRVADQEIQIRDLPVGVLAQISKETDQSWILTQAAPLLNLEVAEKVIEAACQELGIDKPEKLTARTVQDFFVQVDDDLPEQFEDGLPR